MSTPVRWGCEFLVNTTTQSNQYAPSITALADGRFVVTWTDTSQTGGDTSGYAVRAQLFNADGSQSGAEFLVNTTTLNIQLEPTITALADGRFVVAWSDGSQTGGDTSGFAIRAQIFDPREAAVTLTGSALGDDFVGTAFSDTITGNEGNDQLVGGLGDDVLAGDNGDDLMFGRRGADTLIGGAGDDAMTGGLGTDTFVFSKDSGSDIVVDFRDGRDFLDLSDFGLPNFASNSSHFRTSGADLVFTFAHTTLTIQNFTLAQLDLADLIL